MKVLTEEEKTEYVFTYKKLEKMHSFEIYDAIKYFKIRVLNEDSKFKQEFELHTKKELNVEKKRAIKELENFEKCQFVKNIRLDQWCTKYVSKKAWQRYLTSLRVKKNSLSDSSTKLVRVNQITEITISRLAENEEFKSLTKIQIMEFLINMADEAMRNRSEADLTAELLKLRSESLHREMKSLATNEKVEGA